MRLSAKDLIQPVSEEKPCGEDLEYDPAFQEMETLLQSKTEQEFGDTVIPGSGPDWKGVGQKAEEILDRTRDIRPLTYGAVAKLHTVGVVGFHKALEALNACLETFWENIYPELDVEDNNDATMRLNSLQVLNDHMMVCEGFVRSPLVVLKGIGSFSLRDIELSEGKADPVGEEEVQDIALIQGAFAEASPEDLTALGAALGGTRDALNRTVELWGQLAENALPLDLDDAFKALDRVRHAVKTYSPVAAAAAGDEEAVEQGGAEAVQVVESGAINSRNDVIRAIDRICDYYEANEPSSPVPLLMRRAQRMVTKSFYEILEDMIPDSLAQAKVIGGKTE